MKKKKSLSSSEISESEKEDIKLAKVEAVKAID